MPRCRSRRDMTLLQAILDTEGFGEGEHPGSDSTLNTTSSADSNPRRDPRAHQRNPRQASNPRTHPFNPRSDPRVDPLDQALQQKQRELQLLLWQQHVERQVLMQRQMLQQEVVMQTSAYTHRRGGFKEQNREVKGHLHGDRQAADGPSDASDSESGSETARSCSSYSDSFSSCDDESTGSRKSSQKSGSEEGMTKRVTFAEKERREEKKDGMEDRPEKTPAGQKGVKETAGKRKKPRQQCVGRKRTSTHPPFTVTSLSSRYLSLVSSLLQLQLNPQYPGKERARALSSPGKNISEEMLRKRAREEKKKRRTEKRQEEEAASPREKQPFQPSDHDLKNSPNPQVQEWLQRKQAARQQQRREDRAKRRLKFQMKLEERDLRIARMLESDEKVDQWMREKRKLLRRKPQKPRKAVVQPSVVQQAETEVTTPLGNSNQGQPDLPTLEKQAAQLEEKLLKDLGTETGQGDASTGSANGKGQGNTGLTNGKRDAISTNGKGDAISTNGKVGNSTTSPADGKVAGMDDFARRTVPAGRARTENGAQPAGRVPVRPTTAPPRIGSPTKRRGKSLQPASARSRGSKPSPESPGTTPRSSVSPRSTVSASGSPRDPMRNLSYDEWLLHKRQEDRQRRRQVKKQEADPELQSIIPELARRRVDRATAGKQKLDTGLKQRKQDSSREKPADDQENKPRFVWRLRDDPTLERPSTTQPGSRSPTTTRAGSRSPSPGKKSPVRPSSPGKKSPARPSSPLKEPAFYRRQRFSREKMQLYSQRPEPQGSDCPDITTHDNDQSRGSIHTADQSQDSLYTADQSKASLHTADQSQGSLHTADQSEKGTTEAVVDQSEKGTTEVEVIDQPDEKKVDQSESATVKADSQSLSKTGSNQSAPACKTAGQSVNRLFAALGISDEIEENIESESESEDEERLSPSQTFITTVGDTGEGRG
ncbi:PREDICTED: serine/arginine repetitive matrix protein 2-like [Branchiostoma belcheri]|uniref:Serine/arginine repetitive matrix protein 2-like n=1 Tax=Branchiostoma belcheri TaxID=7741 RepID=A0A6P4ZEY6_BRABE|nr:PREDICTED: serine/arginine repetitive matrix protein 2-like [Branchiostoma belcheri]